MPPELVTFLETLLILAGACLALLLLEGQKARRRGALITHAFRWVWQLQPFVVLLLWSIGAFCLGVLTGHFYWCPVCQ